MECDESQDGTYLAMSVIMLTEVSTAWTAALHAVSACSLAELLLGLPVG